MLTALAGGCIFLNFLYFLQKKLSIVPPRASIESFFLHFIKIISIRGSASPFGSLSILEKLVFLLFRPLSPFPCPGFPGCALIFVCRFVYYIINYYNLFLLCYFCSGEDFSQYFLLFSYTFTYYRRFWRAFLFRIKLAIQKGEFFCFFPLLSENFSQ